MIIHVYIINLDHLHVFMFIGLESHSPGLLVSFLRVFSIISLWLL